MPKVNVWIRGNKKNIRIKLTSERKDNKTESEDSEEDVETLQD